MSAEAATSQPARWGVMAPKLPPPSRLDLRPGFDTSPAGGGGKEKRSSHGLRTAVAEIVMGRVGAHFGQDHPAARAFRPLGMGAPNRHARHIGETKSVGERPAPDSLADR